MRYDIDVYQDKRGEWRWALIARNGNILADSGQGYIRKSDCVRMARKLFNHSTRYYVEWLGLEG